MASKKVLVFHIFQDRKWECHRLLKKNSKKIGFGIGLDKLPKAQWTLALRTLTQSTPLVHSITCISLENDISTARALRVTDFTLTFYLEIGEIIRLFQYQLFLRQAQDCFCDQIF